MDQAQRNPKIRRCGPRLGLSAEPAADLGRRRGHGSSSSYWPLTADDSTEKTLANAGGRPGPGSDAGGQLMKESR